jgi:uncharacterized OsmC-like protein
MSTLREYLAQKKIAVLAREARDPASIDPKRLQAHATAEGRSGVRRIRIRDFQIISDSEADYAGYNLGPASPELQLGVLGSCVTHTYLIHASKHDVPLDHIEVDISAHIDPRGGKPGFEDVPVYPQDLSYTVRLTTPASQAEIDRLHAIVERACPILNLLRNPQTVRSTVQRVASEPAAVAA